MREILMENIQKTGDATPTPEEENEEEVQTTNEDEVRSNIIKEYDLDEDEHSEFIDKLTQKEIEQRKAFGKVIEQKRKWREQAQSKGETPEEPKSIPQSGEDVRAIIREEFTQKYIDDLDYPDELKDEVKRIVKTTGKDIKEVVKDPYILYKKEEMEREARNTSASPSGTRKGITVYDENNPPKFDLSTEEGRKQFKDWEKELKAQK
jgi:hypothetical protein